MSGGFSGFYDAAGVIHFFLGWCVEVVQQINLTRVDQRFAVKAQLFDVGGFLQESGFVVSVGIDGIERLNTRRRARPAKWNSVRTAVQFLPGAFCTQVAHIVFCTEGDTDQTPRKRERFPLRG